jgi:hypothetical protein
MIPGLSLPVETLFPGWCAMWAPRGPGEWVMTYRPFAATDALAALGQCICRSGLTHTACSDSPVAGAVPSPMFRSSSPTFRRGVVGLSRNSASKIDCAAWVCFMQEPGPLS